MTCSIRLSSDKFAGQLSCRHVKIRNNSRRAVPTRSRQNRFQKLLPELQRRRSFGALRLHRWRSEYIQNFLPIGAFTLEDMLQLGVEENSVWLSEAQLMLASEFKGSAQTYHEILRRIAAGKNKRAELISTFSIDVSAHLYQLQHDYGLIESLDLVGQNGAKRQRVAYELNDELLDFDFTFILPHQRILQSHNTQAIRQSILRDYPNRSGRVLDRLPSPFPQPRSIHPGRAMVGSQWHQRD